MTGKNPQSPRAKLSRKWKELIKRLDSVIDNGTSNITINLFVVFFFSQNVKLLHEYNTHYESTACQTL